jgi:hypothetical protein
MNGWRRMGLDDDLEMAEVLNAAREDTNTTK